MKIIISWRKKVQIQRKAREKYGYLIVRCLRIAHIEEVPRADIYIAYTDRFIVENAPQGPLWKVNDEIEVIDIVSDNVLSAKRLSN